MNVKTGIPENVKKVYVASPLRAPTRVEVRRNMVYALRTVEKIRTKRPDIRAYAPHAYLPDMLDDNYEDERELALSIGRSILRSCDAIFVCGNRVTSGMQEEIKIAFENGMEIISSKWLQNQVEQFVASCEAAECTTKADDKKIIWIRVGGNIPVDDKDAKAILDDGNTKVFRDVLLSSLSTGTFTPCGETYIPESCIEAFNKANGTSYLVADVDCCL